MKHLYHHAQLAEGQEIVPDKALKNRVLKVLRLKVGASVALFNGKDGVFEVKITENAWQVLRQIAPYAPQPALTLLVAVLKKDNFNNVLRQATEMGVTTIQPVLTEHCVPDKLNLERAEARIIEAAEQCERQDLPVLRKPIKLHDVFADIPEISAAKIGKIFWCDEVEGGKWGNHPTQAGDAVLIGPEGGFSAEERTWLAAQPNIIPVGLGSLILRADTAVVAALSRFQEAFVAE